MATYSSQEPSSHASDLRKRMVKTSEHDLRYYFVDFFKHFDPYTPTIQADWSFVPQEWTEAALKRDSITLFSHLSE